MSIITKKTELPLSLEQVEEWVIQKIKFKRYLPHWMKLTEDDEMVCFQCDNRRPAFKLKQSYNKSNHKLIWTQVQGPFQSYVQTITVNSLSYNRCSIEETIEFKKNFRENKWAKRLLNWLNEKHEHLTHDLLLSLAFPKTPLKILVSGASGFIGSSLVAFLQAQDHDIYTLVRSKKRKGADTIFWDPQTGEINKDDFEGFDAVIHLAGENIFHARWTDKIKERIFQSRCRDTWLLSQVLLRLYQPPKTLISASAVGYYGNRPNEILNEDSAPGTGFLAEVCQQWEKATKAIEERGVRVVHPRFGIVLAPNGGMLKKMVPMFKYWLGAILGAGKQKMSWIALEDLIGALYFLLMHQELHGEFNLTAPQPVTQEKFAQLLASKLHRACWLRIPAIFFRMLSKEVAENLFLSDVEAMPERLIKNGYRFFYPSLEKYLKSLSID